MPRRFQLGVLEAALALLMATSAYPAARMAVEPGGAVAFRQTPPGAPVAWAAAIWRQNGRRREAPAPRNKARGNSRSNAGPARPPRGGARPRQIPLAKLAQLPPEERERALRADPRFQRMPPARQQQLLGRLRWFNSLPRDRQEQFVARQRYISGLTPQQRQQVRAFFFDWRSAPPQRRRALNREFMELRAMSPEQQQAEMNSPQFQSRFSPAEQDLLRRGLDLNLPDSIIGRPGMRATSPPAGE
jgi:hypothetical protein